MSEKGRRVRPAPFPPFRAPGAALVALCIALAGCARSPGESGRLSLRLSENPSTLDPAAVVDVTGGEIAAKLHSGLVRFDDRFRLVGDLAESWSVEDGGRRFVFTLRPGLRFSDGSPLRARHVRDSWKRVLSLDPPSPRRWVLERIRGARDIRAGSRKELPGFRLRDPLTFAVELESAFAPFLSLLTMPAASVVSPKAGAGPYRLVAWVPDEYVEMEPNPYYHDGQAARRASIRYRIVPENFSAVAMAATGALDILKVPRNQVRFLQNKLQDHAFLRIEELNTYYLGFDHRKKELDLAFRRAVAHSVDRPAIIEAVLGGQARPARSPVPPVLLHGVPLPDMPAGSLELARKHFAESAVRGRRLVFLLNSNRESLSLGVILQDRLKKIGAKVELRVLDWSAFKEAVNRGEGDLFLLSWWADYADAENFLYPTFHSSNHGAKGNRVFYSDPETDRLLDLLHTTLEPERRGKLLAAVLERFEARLPWVPLWHRETVFAAAPRVSGFRPVPMYTMDKGITIRIAPKEEPR